jgi:hypothetical protein
MKTINKGQFKQKRSDTKMGTIEKKYGTDFGVRSDKKLGSYLKEQGYPSLSKLLDAKKNERKDK